MNTQKNIILILQAFHTTQDFENTLWKILERAHYQVFVVTDEEAATRYLRQTPPHLILINAPLSSPINILHSCAFFQKNELSRHIPIILASNHQNEEIILKAFQAGIADYFNTNNSYQELLARLCVHLRYQQSFHTQQSMLQIQEQLLVRKNTYLTEVSHEIRTPIQAILGYSQFLAEDLEAIGHSPQDLQKIISAATHLNKLINNALELSKIEASQLVLQYEECSLNFILQEVKSIIQPSLRPHQNQLELRYDTVVLAPITIDSTRLKQILINLLANACKFTLNGHITLCVKQQAQQTQFTVSDTGIGIPADDLPHLFRLNYQYTTKSSTPGLGLGLYLSYKLATLMGGDLSATSEYGKGSTFYLTVPNHPPPEQAPHDYLIF